MSTFKFTGVWHSERYANIDGTVEINLPCCYTDHFETIMVLTYNPHGSFRAGKQQSFELQGMFGSNDTPRYVLMPRELGIGQLFTITFSEHPRSEWIGFYSCIHPYDPYDLGRMMVKCETTCIGCLGDQPNQLAHMDYGGCLYQDSDDDTEEIISDDPPEFDYRSLPVQ